MKINRVTEIVGQNKQQSNLSVISHVGFVRKELVTYYSVERFIYYCCCWHSLLPPLSLRGDGGLGYGLVPGWVMRSGKYFNFNINVYTDINCL